MSRADRSLRDLAALQRTGATSRVLNLALVEVQSRKDPDWAQRPFFRSRTLNTAILVKHRLREDERYVFDGAPTSATKIIVPFANADLALGARAMFVGQRGWRDMVRALCEDSADVPRDLRMLSAVDRLPSLDPFLLREHLKRFGFSVATCYLAISPGDHERMRTFVRHEISRLIDLAFAGQRGMLSDTSRLVDVLLSTRLDERLEPLRRTLGLEGDAYKEGVFSWKGFLYYKWMLGDLWPRLLEVIEELRQVQTAGRTELEDLRYIELARRRLEAAIHQHRREALDALRVYDEAFHDLVENGRPAAFRDFLVKAPGMFTALGERIGAISHLASFWRYRFARPDQAILTSEFVDILQDFEATLGVTDRAVSLDAPRPVRAAAG